MSETKEEALCNNAQNHRQQLLNHQQELERDLEAGSCDEEESGTERSGEESGEGGEGEEDKDGEGEPPKTKQVIPPLYNVEPGCTSLGCYSAIITFIIMVIGIVALLMYSSPANARAANLNETSRPKEVMISTNGPIMAPGDDDAQ
ncbi:uncharacterized protein LOC122242299 [Penaeus japonicus]|uniref:uncharacterized protein LOC122242299 n=1 Tax=Penaeus japonicus TaxID=27405 RepID=UPI001C70B690|nr:uncharacterized protein LOC122242299 [Penaeus japonicus]XP_042855504.1 uncharacterized protein LOC122242299 [Penaeus japonicus]XP_042855505.1 uncharacterized protein LOC122242299 [Penaeus japonicus]XP_042855506.1 uncharacterized protein LOC122242299 [Penaeus japonicus]XP_042855507.1 uncharacterized protein LOC122242299 [Penaeus japonicus]